MFSFNDEAIILAVDCFGEHDAIVSLFTPQHGLCRGIVKRALTGKNRADMQPATLVDAIWKARLPEHMGVITLEARYSFAAMVMHDPLKLAAISSAMHLIANSLAERDAHADLYHQVLTFLQHVVAGTDPLIWLAEYVRLELALLDLAGFGLDLNSCAATGISENLVYVSPKSGRAVSQAAGQPYHARMLPLPVFIRQPTHLVASMAEIMEGMQLTGYFIESRLLPGLHRKPSVMRAHFAALLARHAMRGLAVTAPVG